MGLSLAVRDWRRSPTHPALGGLLDGTLRFGWGRAERASDDRPKEIGVVHWEFGSEGIA
jgi:hypothetical protein